MVGKVLRGRASLAVAAATVAVVIAITGSAVAAGTANPIAGVAKLTSKDKKTVNTLIAAYVKKHPGPRGPAGPSGPAGGTGPQGLQGPQGPAGVAGTTYVESTAYVAGDAATAPTAGDYTFTKKCPAGQVPTGGGMELAHLNPATQQFSYESHLHEIGQFDTDTNNDNRADAWLVEFHVDTGTPAGATVFATVACIPGAATPYPDNAAPQVARSVPGPGHATKIR
jgi:hypothetical protein